MEKILSVIIAALITIFSYGTISNAEKMSIASDGFTINSAKVMNENDNFIYGLKPGITEDELLNNYLLLDDGVEIRYSGKLGTGTSINFVEKSTDTILSTYKLLIIGDVNGDGLCNGDDAVIIYGIANNIFNISEFCESINEHGLDYADDINLYMLAADCDKNGVISENDSFLLQQAGSLLTVIDQNSFYNDTKDNQVTFIDFDGTILSSENVTNGGYAIPPTNPSKNGTSFLGWSGNYANVTQAETVKAVYSDEKNVFMVDSVSGSVGDTVSMLVSVDGTVNLCGFEMTIYYDSSLEAISFDEDLDLDVIANLKQSENKIVLNTSANSNKTKQRDIIELTFEIQDTVKKALPVVIEIKSAKEISGNKIINTDYVVIDGVVNIND